MCAKNARELANPNTHCSKEKQPIPQETGWLKKGQETGKATHEGTDHRHEDTEPDFPVKNQSRSLMSKKRHGKKVKRWSSSVNFSLHDATSKRLAMP